VLRTGDEVAEQVNYGAAAYTTAADVQHAVSRKQQQMPVALVALVTRHKALKEPNMLALL
jgi:hypothetical protein